MIGHRGDFKVKDQGYPAHDQKDCTGILSQKARKYSSFSIISADVNSLCSMNNLAVY